LLGTAINLLVEGILGDGIRATGDRVTEDTHIVGWKLQNRWREKWLINWGGRKGRPTPSSPELTWYEGRGGERIIKMLEKKKRTAMKGGRLVTGGREGTPSYL